MTQTLAQDTTAGSGKLDVYLEGVRSITPLIRSEAAAIEAARSVTKPVADAIYEIGLHWMLVPEDLGGGGLRPSEGMRVYEELSKADASVGWAIMATSWATAEVIGYLNPEVQKALTDEKFIAAGQLLPRYPAVKVDGGYIIDGVYSFASGSDYATWMGAGFLVADENKNPILDENGKPQARVALIRKDQVELIKNWDVWGLAGTGSHDYRVDKVFVPEEYTIPTFGGTPNRSETMYKLSNEFVGGLCHAPVVLGIAGRALELVAAMTHDKTRPNYPVPVSQSELFRIEFGRREADLQAARLWVYEVVEAAERHVEAGGKVTPEHLARAQQMLAWSHQVTADIVTFAHRWSGTRSIGSTNELGRFVRDMEVATQHLLVDVRNYVDAAAVLLPSYVAAGS